MRPEHDFKQLLKELQDARPAVACAAVRQLQAISEQDAYALYDIRKPLLHQAMRTGELRVRWNLIIVLGRLSLKARDRAVLVDWLFERLGDASSLTRTFTMQTLVNLSSNDPPLRRRVLPVVMRFNETGTAAMRTRARKLLREMGTDARDI
jgi:hypothetical protein